MIPRPLQRLIANRPCPSDVLGLPTNCEVWASSGGDFDHPNMNPSKLCAYCAETYRRIVVYWSKRKRMPKGEQR